METGEMAYRQTLPIVSDGEKEEGEGDPDYEKISAAIDLNALQGAIEDMVASGVGN